MSSIPSTSKQSLIQIIEVSRQLLSCILVVQNKIQDNASGIQAPIPKKNSEPDNKSTRDNEISMVELTELLANRDTLIRNLFAQNLSAEIAIEQELLNEMASLDKQLADHLQVCKKALAGQVIKLKKGSKAAKSYQKY